MSSDMRCAVLALSSGDIYYTAVDWSRHAPHGTRSSHRLQQILVQIRLVGRLINAEPQELCRALYYCSVQKQVEATDVPNVRGAQMFPLRHISSPYRAVELN